MDEADNSDNDLYNSAMIELAWYKSGFTWR